jgi:hypothetical protein
MAAGKARLKNILINARLDVVENGEGHSRWSAIEFGLRHINNWRDDVPGVQLDMGDGNRAMRIQFVMPDKVLELDDEPPRLPAPRRDDVLDLKANAPNRACP